jgi:MerR family transcriptional regulator, redox-sensitive transcriptional activator SoxR
MLTIGQVASRTGLRASAIRYYEAQGLLPRPSRQAGKRMYSSSILDRLAVIELAKIAGFGLSEIRVLLSHVESGEPSAAWRTLLPAKAVEIDAQMDRLVRMKDILAKLNACTCATLEECGRAYIQARLSQASNQRVQPLAPRRS